MWPFRKKPPRSPATAPFQEFLRSYVPPAPKPVHNPIQEETVCSLCFEQFPAGTVSADYPSCPDCSSEGMDCGVMPLQNFLAPKTLDELDEIARHWNAAQGFLPQYKARKANNIAQLRARKVAGGD
jgi:predicted amidophosphoribosyltransferase